ncbi:hypothetical protein M231_00221 [Tremella mesenterica]|uniref:Uncharacterized protein n=1 Tax=Tremella mesenterica TaxID=5217 RepID=A0A4Q1BX53_TREME|nr:hypothetical protein M231_00221 [Tremella mesenterica]
MAPPPSLASSNSTSSTRRPSYTRNELFSLAQTPDLPSIKGLEKFPIIRERRETDGWDKWGIDESFSSLLNNEPISKLFPVPPSLPSAPVLIPSSERTSTTTNMSISTVSSPQNLIRLSESDNTSPIVNNKTSEEQDKKTELVFEYLSPASKEAPAPPIRLAFTNPFDTSRPLAEQKKPSAVSIFNTPGSLSRTSSTSTASTLGMMSLGKDFDNLRLHRSMSRSSSISSVSSGSADDPDWRKSQKKEERRSTLNRFAAPWPLPATTPVIAPMPSSSPGPRFQALKTKIGVSDHGMSHPEIGKGVNEAKDEGTSLPLPKAASLPPRPGPIAPVYVKRESAALAQPMSLPNVAPMSHIWETEEAMSGNERRRRASEVSGGQGWQTPSRGTSDAGSVSSEEGRGQDQRPERLVNLGKSLRKSVSEKVRA